MNRFLIALLYSVIACSVAAMPSAGDTAVYQQTFCSNQIVIINNNVYGPFKTEGIEVIPGGAANGMDSIFKVMLFFYEAVERDYNLTLCEGDSVKINNNIYHQGFYQGTEVFENAAANGCDSILHVKIDFIAPPYSIYIDTLCYDASVSINGVTYDRQNRSGLEILGNASATGCDSLVYISLFFRQQWVYLGPDTIVTEGDSLCVQVEARYDKDLIEWNPAPPCTNPECLSFCTPRLYQPTKFAITYTDTYGCVSRDEIRIAIDKNHRVYGGNVFAPDGDEPNNRFFITADRGVARILKLMVYDRWGEPVFLAENVPNDPDAAYNAGWDGRKQDTQLHMDVYTWWAELETYSGERFQRTGDVLLLR